MKLKLAILTAAFFAFGVSSVQAVDTRTPDILSSVSSGSVQVLTKAESADVRGEYRYCMWLGVRTECTGWMYSRIKPRPDSAPYGRYLQVVGPYFGWYASR